MEETIEKLKQKYDIIEDNNWNENEENKENKEETKKTKVIEKMNDKEFIEFEVKIEKKRNSIKKEEIQKWKLN